MGKVLDYVMLVTFFILSVVAAYLLWQGYNSLPGNQEVTEIYLQDQRVLLTDLAKTKLDAIYTDNLTKEIPFCLSGFIDSGGVVISDASETQIIEHNESYALFAPCPATIGHHKFLGIIHNHPGGSCYLSGQDLQTYAADLRNGLHVMGLKCEKGYVFYLLSIIPTEVDA